jgi:phytoene dehydrogenase-like protein
MTDNRTTIPSELPILPVRDMVLFPGGVLPLTVGRESSLALLNSLEGQDRVLGIISQLDPRVEDPTDVDLHRVGTMAKLNLALDALPRFTALKQSQDGNAALSGRIHIGPEIDYLERAFDASKYGEFSPAPYLDISIPSLLDSSLAPAGKHVMSICMQFAPYKLRSGDWSSRRESLSRAILDTLAAYAPDLPGKILAQQLLTPQDLDDSYSLTGGHPFHGELSLDQIFTMRPLLGWARYATPVRNLYLCGSGTHPGNGLTGASGANAAREILRDIRR